MKINKTMVAVALGLSMAVAAQADTDGPDAGYTAVYITGSTAFRGQIFSALSVDLGLNTHIQGNGGANSFTCEGTEAASVNLTGYLQTLTPHGALNEVGQKIEALCTFSGSAEGCGALLGVAPYATATYLDAQDSGTFSHTGVDFAFSDVGQDSTPYNTVAAPVGAGYGKLPEIRTPNDVGLGLPNTGMAVVPFTFAANKSALVAGLNNITSFDFRNLYYPASSGNADMGNFANTQQALGATPAVVAVGRYNLSGTRITAVLDDAKATDYQTPLTLLANPLSQWGLGDINATTANTYGGANGTTNPPYMINGSANPNGTASPGGYPDNADLGWIPVGNDGYFSGGNLGVALDYSGSVCTPAIGYIAWSDAQGKFSAWTAPTGTPPNTTGGHGGAAPITFNGQVAIASFTPGAAGNVWNLVGLENGAYSFWSYERLYENPNDVGHPNKSFMDLWGSDLVYAVQTEIIHASPQTADLIGNMSVYRGQDGGDIIPEVAPQAPN